MILSKHSKIKATIQKARRSADTPLYCYGRSQSRIVECWFIMAVNFCLEYFQEASVMVELYLEQCARIVDVTP